MKRFNKFGAGCGAVAFLLSALPTLAVPQTLIGSGNDPAVSVDPVLRPIGPGNPGTGGSVSQHPITQGQVAPDDLTVQFAVPQMSAEERQSLSERLRTTLLSIRERLDASVVDSPPSVGTQLPLEIQLQLEESQPDSGIVPETQVDVAADGSADDQLAAVDFHGAPGNLSVFRNRFNPRAATVGVGSTLAEPAAVNDGAHVFYMGNTHAEFSTDGGTTFTNVPIPAGPSDAQFPCCDPYVVHDDARRVTFWLMLYTNAGLTNGVIRIFVRRSIPAGNSCSYTIRYGSNVVPDYPKLALSNNHIYLATNNVQFPGPVWIHSQVRRFNVDQMADCVTTSFQTFTYTGGQFAGQRVFRPVQGAWETMYWALHETSNFFGSGLFRIFRWRQQDNAVTSHFRLISPPNFVNPDCRGGVNNLDWIQRNTSFSITGFRMPGAIGKHQEEGRLTFYWNVGPDSQHSQAHVHAASFRESDLQLQNQPHIFNNGFCFGYPAVAANKRGGLGLSIGAGGQAGGGGSAVRGFIGVDDDFTPGYGFFQTVFLTAFGTHNPANQRFGDYFTVFPHEPCEKVYNATNYALLNGTGVANVNARYVEFGRQRDRRCYDAYNNAEPFEDDEIKFPFPTVPKVPDLITPGPIN